MCPAIPRTDPIPEFPNLQLALNARVRPSPYFESTLEHGVGAVTIYNHMVMPVHYGGVEAGYHDLTEGVTVWDVGGQRQVEITGPDAAAFTQYLVTRDISTIVPGRARYTLVCQDDGGILNDPVLLRLADDHFWLSLADSDILLWAKGVAHGSSFDVELGEPDVSPIQVQGPRSIDLVGTLFGELVDGLKFYQFVETDLEGIPMVVSRTGWSGEHGYEIFLRDGSKGAWLWERLFSDGEPFGAKAGAPNNIRRIEAGLLSYGADMNSSMNPIELGLEKFVDLDGPDDFIGKKALEGIVSEGPARRRIGVILDGEPIDQSPIRWWPVTVDGEESGVVTSATWSPGLERNIAYAILRTDHAVPNITATVHTPVAARQAITTPIPFVGPRYR